MTARIDSRPGKLDHVFRPGFQDVFTIGPIDGYEDLTSYDSAKAVLYRWVGDAYTSTEIDAEIVLNPDPGTDQVKVTLTEAVSATLPTVTSYCVYLVKDPDPNIAVLEGTYFSSLGNDT